MYIKLYIQAPMYINTCETQYDTISAACHLKIPYINICIIENIPIACKLQDARHRIQNTKNNIQYNTNMCMKVHSYQMKHNRAADICVKQSQMSIYVYRQAQMQTKKQT